MNILTSPLMEVLPHVFHGFGMRSEEVPAGIVFPKQVHGDHIEVLKEPVPEAWHREADAVLTHCPFLPIGVKTADCLPILMADRKGKGVGAIHAGWKGVALGILPKAIRQFSLHFGVEPEEMVLAVGPAIGGCCLEVDAPVRDLFLNLGQEAYWKVYARPGRPGHWWLDLKAIVQEQALGEGVRRENVDILPYCTCCEKDYFYSYRREGLAAGRQMNYIVLKEFNGEG